MLFLANAIMKSPLWAMALGALLGASTLVFSPIGILSGAAVALVTLASGYQFGLKMLLSTLLGAWLMVMFSESTTAFWIACVEFWLPVLVLASVLGKVRSLSRMLEAAAFLAMTGLLIAYGWLSPSPEAFWLAVMQDSLAQWQAQGVYIEPTAVVMLTEELPAVLTMLVGMAVLMVWMSILLLARWWQSQLYSLEPLGREFREIRVSHLSAGMFAGLLLMSIVWSDMAGVNDLLGVMTLLFMVQGLAVIHQWVFVKQSGNRWLVLVYVMLTLLPHFMMMVAMLGWVENWMDWRSKMNANPQA